MKIHPAVVKLFHMYEMMDSKSLMSLKTVRKKYYRTTGGINEFDWGYYAIIILVNVNNVDLADYQNNFE
jgi:hypothetical protein